MAFSSWYFSKPAASPPNPGLRIQFSDCSPFRIMCDVPNTAVFFSESTECFLGMASKFFFIIIIIIIIIILGISFMQGIYTYIPETNHVPREHCVATILQRRVF
jgi:hypothetical protein